MMSKCCNLRPATRCDLVPDSISIIKQCVGVVLLVPCLPVVPHPLLAMAAAEIDVGMMSDVVDN